jgi:hypothetical protein
MLICTISVIDGIGTAIQIVEAVVDEDETSLSQVARRKGNRFIYRQLGT